MEMLRINELILLFIVTLLSGQFVTAVHREECGIRTPSEIGSAANNKDNAQCGEFPWMTAILSVELHPSSSTPLKVYRCGGSLIHPQVVLTSALCLQNRGASSLKVRVGEWDTQETNELHPHQDRDVAEVIVHDQFEQNGTDRNGLALLYLTTPVELAENVNTVCLPPQDFNFDEARCTASGWGKGKDGKFQTVLAKVDLSVAPRTSCLEAFRSVYDPDFDFHNSFICAKAGKEKDLCVADRGSPLVCPISDGKDQQYYQAGIAAWHVNGCDDQHPGTYVNVALFRQWIEEQFDKKNLDKSQFTA